MSWDVFIARFPPEVRDTAELPNEWRPESMGTIATVRAVIDRAIPTMRWDESGRGDGAGQGFDVLVSLHNANGGDEDQVAGVFLMFYGSGHAGQVSLAIAEALSARALDGGEFLDAENAQARFAGWQRYRDQACGRSVE